MCNRNVIAIILVFATSVLLSSCGRNCAPYPEDMAKFMPVQYDGGELTYLIGKDTCTLTVGAPLLDKGYKLSLKDLSYMSYCESFATLSVGGKDSYSIEYTQRRSMEGIIVQLHVDIGYMEQQKYEEIQFSYDFEDTLVRNIWYYEILSEYMAPTGKTYSPVLFWVDWSKDSLWVSYDEGLVRYVPNCTDTTPLGQVWQLL